MQVVHQVVVHNWPLSLSGINALKEINTDAIMVIDAGGGYGRHRFEPFLTPITQSPL